MSDNKYLTDSELMAILTKVYDMTGSTPVVTMGAAVDLYCGRELSRDKDIDVLVPGVFFNHDEYSVSPDGVYRGFKRIIEIDGVTVELLGDFSTCLPDEHGSARQLIFPDFPQQDMVVRYNVGDWDRAYIPISKIEDLTKFYCAMNRPKDKEKLKRIAARIRLDGGIVPASISKALGSKVWNLNEMTALMAEFFASPGAFEYRVDTLDSDCCTSTVHEGDAERKHLIFGSVQIGGRNEVTVCETRPGSDYRDLRSHYLRNGDTIHLNDKVYTFSEDDHMFVEG